MGIEAQPDLVPNLISEVNKHLARLSVAAAVDNIAVLAQSTGAKSDGTPESIALARVAGVPKVGDFTVLLVAERPNGIWITRGSSGGAINTSTGRGPVSGRTLIERGKRVLIGLYSPTTPTGSVRVTLDGTVAQWSDIRGGSCLALVPIGSNQQKIEVEAVSSSGQLISSNTYQL